MTTIYFLLITLTFFITDTIFKKSIILKFYFYFYFVWALSVVLLSIYLNGLFVIDPDSIMQFLDMVNLLLFSILMSYVLCILFNFSKKKIHLLKESFKDKPFKSNKGDIFFKSNKGDIFFYLNLFIIIGSILLIFFGIGINKFIFGHYYLETNSQIMRVIGSNLIFFSVISLILSIFFFNKSIKFEYLLSILMVVIIFLAIDSRRVVIVITLLSSLILFKKSNSLSFLKILLVIIMGIYINSFIISFRYTDEVGLVNLISYLFQKNENFLTYTSIDTLNNILKGGYVFIKMSEGSNFQTTDLITGLNPLTSNFTNWYSRVNLLRINPFVPYNILGELYFFNNYIFFFYFLFVGIIMSFIENMCFDKITSKNTNRKYLVLLLIIFALFGMFLIYSTQYNLRACNRYIVYSIIFYILFKLKKENNNKKNIDF